MTQRVLERLLGDAIEADLDGGRQRGCRRCGLEGHCRSARRVRLTVQDDGKGFPEGTASSGRFGLVGMQERARLLGGSFQVESSPGAGTRITAEVPLRRS